MTPATPLSRFLTRWLAALSLALFPLAARADLRITEISPGAAGAENSVQWVELMNAGAGPLDVNGLWIGADGRSAARLAGLAPVPPGGFLVIHWKREAAGPAAAGPLPGGASVQFWTGPVADLRAERGSLILSRTAELLDPDGMLAFAQWGAPRQPGADVAEGLGLWPADRHLPAAVPGHSLALAPGGSPRSPAGWFDASVPTPGAVNTAPVSAWRGWRLVGAAALTPAATWDVGSDLLDVIAVSPSFGTLTHYRHQAGLWSPGLPVEGATLLPVGLAGSGPGVLDLVLTAPDGEIGHRRFTEGRWGPLLSLGRGAALPPALAYNPAAKELELVVADAAGALQFARAADGVWTAWSPVGAVAAPVAPTLAINILDRPFDLLFTAPDGMIKGVRFAGGAWGFPLPARGYTMLPPAVAVTGSDTVEVVVTSPDGLVYHNELTDGLWGVWRWTGAVSDTAPALLSSPAEYGLELFTVDRDGRLQHTRFVNGSWGRSWSLGGVTGQPAAVTAGPDGGLELLMAGADGNLWHNRFQPAAPEMVSLSRQVQPILDVHCVQCHDSGEPLAGQNLEPDAAYFSTVNVTSTQLRRMPRIDPGNPDNSYLIHKVSGTHLQAGGTGERMPQGGRLTDAEIQTIRAWIAQGALNN